MAINAYIPSVQKISEHHALTALNAIDNLSADTELLGAPGVGKEYAIFGLAAGTNDTAGDYFSGAVISTSGTIANAGHSLQNLTQVACNIKGPLFPSYSMPILCGDNKKVYFDQINTPSAESSPLNLLALYYTVVDV